MKILIFASPRSGSTALAVALSKLLNFPKVLEPYNILNTNGISDEQILNLKDNLPGSCVVKVSAKHMSREFFLEYVNLFDKVIYLTREDSKLAIESFYYASHKKEFKNINYPGGSKWHLGYSFNSSGITMDEWIVKYINNSVEEVKTVAYINKKSYIIYEDLYSEDISLFNNALDSIDLSIDRIKLREILHPSKKYRKKIKTKTII